MSKPVPASKKPRKKSPQSGSASSELDALPNIATMESLSKELDIGPEDDALRRAQDLVYDAWEAPDGRSRNALARKALKISPFCADAWLMLAERPSLSARNRREFLERAVKAGEFALGNDGFAEYDGHFWGFLETRPYMRARHVLAEDLWYADDRKAAIGHLREMLSLNPGDNQGLRYILLSWLLHMGDDAATKAHLRDHGDEASTFICYTKALFSFKAGSDDDASRLAAREAWECNHHVPKLLANKGKVRFKDTGYYTPGGEDEAAYYLEDYGFAWKQTSGAIEWLSKVTESLTWSKSPNTRLH